MKTCTIEAKCTARGGVLLGERKWLKVDIMKISHTRAWCTQMLNKHPQDGVRIWWRCVHDQAAQKGFDYRYNFEGTIVRIQGSLYKRGYFE